MYKYLDAKFKIETGYEWGKGLDKKRTMAFYDEIALAFLHEGWTIQPAGWSSGVIYVIKDKTRLYVHPMEITGPRREDIIKQVTDIITGCTTCTLTEVKTFNELLDIEGDELEKAYDKMSKEADAAIIQSVIRRGGIPESQMNAELFRLSDRFVIKTIKEPGGIRSSGDSAHSFLKTRLEELIKNKTLDKNSNGIINLRR